MPKLFKMRWTVEEAHTIEASPGIICAGYFYILADSQQQAFDNIDAIFRPHDDWRCAYHECDEIPIQDAIDLGVVPSDFMQDVKVSLVDKNCNILSEEKPH